MNAHSQQPKIQNSPHPSLWEVKMDYENLNPETLNLAVVEKPILFEDGLLFSYEGGADEVVYVVGSFSQWKKRYQLREENNGVKRVFIPLRLKKGSYAYRFLVNGVFVNDPMQPFTTFDKQGNKLSSFVLMKPLRREKRSPLLLEEQLGKKKYRFLLKDRGYKTVHWTGEETRYAPQLFPMQLVEGYWQLEKIIEGRGYYFFLVDGEKTLDPLNPTVVELFKDQFSVNVAPP